MDKNKPAQYISVVSGASGYRELFRVDSEASEINEGNIHALTVEKLRQELDHPLKGVHQFTPVVGLRQDHGHPLVVCPYGCLLNELSAAVLEMVAQRDRNGVKAFRTNKAIGVIAEQKVCWGMDLQFPEYLSVMMAIQFPQGFSRRKYTDKGVVEWRKTFQQLITMSRSPDDRLVSIQHPGIPIEFIPGLVKFLQCLLTIGESNENSVADDSEAR